MNKLTAEKCRSHIARLKRYEGESLYQFPFEIEMLEAFEIALSALERIETVESGLEGALKLHRLRTAEEGHSQLSDGFRAGARWAAKFSALPHDQASAKPQIDNDCWTHWAGGECPVDNNEVVYVKFRDGEIDDDGTKAGRMRWSHIGKEWDIIAYRIIPERATNQNGEQ